MQAHAVLDHAQPRLINRVEYDRLVAAGMFENERVELSRGIVVQMSPVGPAHADPIDVLNHHFVRASGPIEAPESLPGLIPAPSSHHP
jgi:hypothetical protein